MILRFFKYLFFLIIALITLATVALYLVWNNSLVTQKVLALVKDNVSGLTWDKVEGTLSTGITFSNLRYVTEHYGYSADPNLPQPAKELEVPTLVDVTIPYVTTHLSFDCLIKGQVCLDYLHAKDAFVVVAIGDDHKFDKFGKQAYSNITLADILPRQIVETPSGPSSYPAWLIINGNDVQLTDFNVIIGDNIGLAQYSLNQKLLLNQKTLFPYQISEQMRTGRIVLNGKTLPNGMRYVATLNNFALEHLPYSNYNKYLTKPMIIRLGGIFANHFSYSKDRFNKVVLDNARSENVHLLFTEEKNTLQVLAEQEQQAKAQVQAKSHSQDANLVINFYDKDGKSVPHVVKSNLIPSSLKSLFSKYFYIHDQGVSPSYLQLFNSLSQQHVNSAQYLINSALSDLKNLQVDQSGALNKALKATSLGLNDNTTTDSKANTSNKDIVIKQTTSKSLVDNSKSDSNKQQDQLAIEHSVVSNSLPENSSTNGSSAKISSTENSSIKQSTDNSTSTDQLSLDTNNLLIIPTTLSGKQNSAKEIIKLINSNLAFFKQPASKFLLAKENSLELPLILNTKNVHISGVSLNFVNYNSQQFLINSVNYDLSQNSFPVPTTKSKTDQLNQVSYRTSIVTSSKVISSILPNSVFSKSDSSNIKFTNSKLANSELANSMTNSIVSMPSLLATVSSNSLPSNFDSNNFVSGNFVSSSHDLGNDSIVSNLDLGAMFIASAYANTNGSSQTPNQANIINSSKHLTTTNSINQALVKAPSLSTLHDSFGKHKSVKSNTNSRYTDLNHGFQTTGVYPLDTREVITPLVEQMRQFSILPSNFKPIPGYIDLVPIDSFNFISLDVDGNLHPKSSNLVVVSHGDIDADLSLDYDSNSTQLSTSAQIQINKLPFVRLPLQVNLDLAIYGQLNHSLEVKFKNQGYNANAVAQFTLITDQPQWPIDFRLQLDSFNLKDLTLNPVYITAHGLIDHLQVKIGAGVVADNTPFAILANLEQQAGKLDYDLRLVSNSKVYTRFLVQDLISQLSDSQDTALESKQSLPLAAQTYFQKQSDQDIVIVPIDALNKKDFTGKTFNQNQVMQINLLGSLTYQNYLGMTSQLGLQDLHVTEFVKIPNISQLVPNGHLELSAIYNSQQDWSLLIHDWNLNGKLNGKDFSLNSDISVDSVAGLHINNLVLDYLTNYIQATGKANSNIKLALDTKINDLSTLVPNIKIDATSQLELLATTNRQDLSGFIKVPLLEVTKGTPNTKVKTALTKINQQLQETAKTLALNLPELNLGKDFNGLGAIDTTNTSNNTENSNYYNASNLTTYTTNSNIKNIPNSKSSANNNNTSSEVSNSNDVLVHMTNVLANLDLHYIDDIGGKAKVRIGKSDFGGFSMDSSTITFVDTPQNHLNIDFTSSVASLKTSLNNISVKLDQPIVADVSIEQVNVPQGHIYNLKTTASFHVSYDLAKQQAQVSPFTLVNKDLNLSLVNTLSYTPKRLLAKFNLNKFDLNYVNSYTQSADLTLAGKVNGTINLDLNPSNIELNSNKVKVDLHTPQIKLTQNLNDQKDLNILIKNLDLGVSADGVNASLNNTMLVAGSPLAIKANVTNYLGEGNLTGTLKLSDLSLKVIKPFLENGQKIDGNVSTDLRLAGSIHNPLVYGQAYINNLDVDMVDLPFEVKKGKLMLDFNGDNAQVKGNLATDSTPILLTGTANWQDLADITSQVNVKTKDLQLKILDYTRAKLDSNISATYSTNSIVLRGDAVVHDSLISVPSNVNSGFDSPSDDVVLINNKNIPLESPVHSDTLQKLDVILNAKIGKNVVFNSYGVDALLAGGVTVTYQQAKLGILGTISIPQGTFEQYGQSLIVKKGDITFNGINIIPNIDIKAIRNPAFMNDTSVTVGVQVSGPATKPVISLFSNPSLPESQKINYLLTGSPSDSEGSVGLQLFTSSLSSSLGLVEKIGEAFGIKNLQFSTAKSGEDSQVTLSGTVFKKLRLNYAYGLFNGLTELSASYRLLPRIFIQLSHGLSDAIDAVYNISW